MGPPPKYYDIARTGQADITWFLHGATPVRFPLTELSHLPYLVGSAEIGTKVLNDPELRSKYLDVEHKGIKVLMLFTHQPGQIFTRDKPVRSVADMQGLRIRFASTTIKDFVDALGATPVGVPPTEMAENLQKGTIDGVFIDYGGAGIAFKLGPHVKYSTEMYSYVTSFGLGMNPDSYAALPEELQKLIDESLVGVEAEVGARWDGIDAPGKKIMMEAGMEPIRLDAEADAQFKEIGAQVAEARIKEMEEQGLPAREVYQLMQELAAKYTPGSKNFWQQE
jgi:TRAP-type C4-dicarboxylate transport system substrate-binding protein